MIRKFVLSTRNRERSAYVWNTAAAMLSSFQTVFILMIISRIDPVNDAGIFTIAFAVANLMMSIGKYGMRQFQVSDMARKYSFKTYVRSRVLSNSIMVCSCIVYLGYHILLNQYTLEKTLVIIFVCLVKLVDSVEDIYHGEFQKKGRLDVAGKILTTRLVMYIIVYILAYVRTNNLVISSIWSFLISAGISLIFNKIACKELLDDKRKVNNKEVLKLLKECLPLVISSFLVMYVGNAPKYALDTVLSSEEQACFGYVFMPVFVIGLLSQFIYQPIIYKLALLRNTGEISKLKSQVLKQMYIILGLTLITMIGGKILGIPILSIIYGVDLSGYENILMVLLFGGGILACVNFFQVIITIFRKQKVLMNGYLIGFLILWLSGRAVVRKGGMMGITIFYVCIVSMIMIIFGVQLVKCFKRETVDLQKN